MSIAISNGIGDSVEALEALEAYLGHRPLFDISHRVDPCEPREDV